MTITICTFIVSFYLFFQGIRNFIKNETKEIKRLTYILLLGIFLTTSFSIALLGTLINNSADRLGIINDLENSLINNLYFINESIDHIEKHPRSLVHVTASLVETKIYLDVFEINLKNYSDLTNANLNLTRFRQVYTQVINNLVYEDLANDNNFSQFDTSKLDFLVQDFSELLNQLQDEAARDNFLEILNSFLSKVNYNR